MNVLVVDVGGSHIKILVTGQKDRRELSSGPKLTAAKMAAKVKQLAADWQYDVVAIGYPGPVSNQRIAAEPHNLGKGWVGFDFAAAFGRPVKLINDAAMQRCKRLAVIAAAECCSSDSAPASAPR